MKYTIFFLLCTVTVAFTNESGKIPPSEEAPKIAEGPTTKPTTTAVPTTSKSTTVAPTTSTAAPTTSTAAPTTSTVAPTTGTPTTAAPTTTATTTVRPASDKWILMDNGTVCLMATMKIKFEIPYNDSKAMPAMGRLEVPDTAEATGFCSASNWTLPQRLKLTWRSPNNTSPNATDNWVQFSFMANSENKTASLYRHYWLTGIEASIVVSDSIAFPNMTGKYSSVMVKNETVRFDTPLGSSYSCGPADNIPLSVNPAMVASKEGQLVLASLQVEAFMSSKDHTFSSAINCENSQTPDFVPILVGSFLIALVIIVLAAYIITRRRALARGYLSM